MLVLSFVRRLLLIPELIWSTSALKGFRGPPIRVIFLAECLQRFALAPDRRARLRRDPVSAIALVAPGLRVRIVGSANRGMAALMASFGRRGLGSFTASLATCFIGREDVTDDPDISGPQDIATLCDDMRRLAAADSHLPATLPMPT
jgi:hypothetical protein